MIPMLLLAAALLSPAHAGVSAPGEIVHWQLNTDRGMRTSFPGYVPVNFVKRMKEQPLLPDLVATQECSAWCACGPDNYDEKTNACKGPPKPGSLLREMNQLLGAEYGVVSAPGNTSIFYRKGRLAPSKSWTFSSYQTGCGMTATMAVFKDRQSPGRHVAALTDHIGNIPSCLVQRVRWADAKLADYALGEGIRLDYVFLSGDWNMRVDVASPTEAERRAERRPQCWWRLLTRGPNGTCGAEVSDYLDPVRVKHPGDSICSQFTFNNPASPFPSAGSCSTRPSSGVLWRIDYTLVRGRSASPANILDAKVDQGYYDADRDGRVDGGYEKYSGHRAVFTRVKYGGVELARR